MIERVWVESLLHGFGPLLVRDSYITNRQSEHSAKSIDNLAHRWGFARQRVERFGRQAGTNQKGCSDASYVCGAGEGEDGASIAPR